jgi:hypothetical protein
MRKQFIRFVFLSTLVAIFIWPGLACNQKQPPADKQDSQTQPTVVPKSSSGQYLVLATAVPNLLEYVAEDVTGTVLLVEKDSKKAEPLLKEETVQAGDEIITMAESRVSLALDENTQFHLSPDSRILVTQLAPNQSQGFLCRLNLLKGKVLSAVGKLMESRSSFEVESGGIICGVRGTVFEVQAEEDQVEANTFEGVVEVAKGDTREEIAADKHTAFSLGKGAFLPQRSLTQDERDRFLKSQTQRALVRQRHLERKVILKNLENLPLGEQARVMRDLDKVRPKDRLKTIRHRLQEKYRGDRVQMLENATQRRSETLEKVKQDAAQKRLENSRLRNTRPNKPQNKLSK